MDSGSAGGHPLDAPRITPEQLRASMPPRIRAAFPPFGWTEETLWRLDLPVEEVAVDTFDWLRDLPIWRWQGRRFQLSLSDVLNNLGKYRAHHERAERSDTSCPIHVTLHNGRWIILDGYHRLLKTLIRRGSTIKVVKVRAGDLALIT